MHSLQPHSNLYASSTSELRLYGASGRVVRKGALVVQIFCVCTKVMGIMPVEGPSLARLMSIP